MRQNQSGTVPHENVRTAAPTACPPLPPTGFLRLSTVLTYIPVSKSAWWDGVRRGRYPQPIKLGPKTTAWKAEDIHELIKSVGGGVA